MPIYQGIDDWNLVRDLRAAEDGDKRMLWVVDDAPQVIQLFLHQESRGGPVNILRDAYGRSVSAMRRAESVVDVNITEARQLFGKLRVVLLFFLVKTQILKQQHVAVRKRINLRLHFITDAIISETDHLAQQRCQMFGHGP